jgi:hypothetical protein
MEFLVVVDDQVYQNLVIAELKHEARLSDRQIRMAEWSQFADGKMKTWRDREVKLSDELYSAIASLPVSGRRVFKIRRSSLLLEMPEAPKRPEPTPVITDEKELLAKLIAEKLLN